MSQDEIKKISHFCLVRKRPEREAAEGEEAKAEGPKGGGTGGQEAKASKVLEKSTKKSSEEEHRVDAQAPYAEEGRGQLRKATRSRKQALIRRYPNGGTRRGKCPVTYG